MGKNAQEQLYLLDTSYNTAAALNWCMSQKE